MRGRVRALLLACLSGLFAASIPAGAQRVDRVPGRSGAPAQDRQGLERQFRERLAQIVQRRLNLDAAQMRRLGDVNGRFEQERMRLLRDERQVRQALRAEVLAGDSANQTRVAELLDRALKIQHQRLDLTEREQRELAQFMTPRQRAMYFGIQDDLRRRMEELRQQRQRQQRRGGPPGMGPRPPLP